MVSVVWIVWICEHIWSQSEAICLKSDYLWSQHIFDIGYINIRPYMVTIIQYISILFVSIQSQTYRAKVGTQLQQNCLLL